MGMLLSILLLGACESRQERAELVLVNGAEPETLDPAIISGQPEGRIANALFEGLLAFDEHGRPVPGVASSWTVSPDGRTYTFAIRTDALWSDGTPVTAHDFEASWRRVLEPSTGSVYSYLLFCVWGAEDFAAGKLSDFSKVGIRALDAQTLEVELINPTPYFLDLCAFVTLQPTPARVIAEQGDSWIKPEHIVNNGAFLLDSWRINDRIRLRKNPKYWNADAVSLETVEILPISKANVAFNFYSSGLVDVVLDKGLAPTDLLDTLRTRKDFHSAPFLGSYFLRFNCQEGPFRDPRVREAFSLAIDKTRLTSKITRGGEIPAASFVPPGIPGYDPAAALPSDLTRARQLMTEAGYPDGKGFPLISYLYSESELNQAIAVELQNMWGQALGVRVGLDRQEWKVYLNSLNALDYGIARSSWVGDYPDPTTFLDMFLAGSGNNRTGWENPHYDDLLARAGREPDPSARMKILREAEALLLREAPICPLYYYVGIQLYDPDKIGGIAPNLLDEHPIRRMYRKQPDVKD